MIRPLSKQEYENLSISGWDSSAWTNELPVQQTDKQRVYFNRSCSHSSTKIQFSPKGWIKIAVDDRWKILFCHYSYSTQEIPTKVQPAKQGL